MDRVTKEQRSKNMSKIRSSGTEFEKRILRELRTLGLSFQNNYSKVIGKPDIAKPKNKIAIFLHSDFWHGWQFPRWEKILPSQFWKQKIRNNRKRDRYVINKLRGDGWRVMVVWEHSYKTNMSDCIDNMASFLH